MAADLATAEGCATLVAKLPHVDILINNAGIFQPSDFFDTPDEVWDRHWQVNVMSAVRLSRAYLPGMQKANWGRVIFIASESGFESNLGTNSNTFIRTTASTDVIEEADRSQRI